MKFHLYCMQDKTSGIFLQPFCARSETDARRQLTLAFEDLQFMQTPAGRYPQEFEMYHVGTFDDDTAIIQAMPVPRKIVNLAELRPKPAYDPALDPIIRLKHSSLLM